MADLPESNEWVPGIYQLETSDPVLGGPEGVDNLQGKQLASRTKWLKDQIEKLVSGAASVGKAVQLLTARTISITGAGTGSASFDGTANAAIALTLANSGVTAGTYAKVTINVKGLVTAGGSLVASDIPALDWSKITTGKPTTLGGYNITDAFTKIETGSAIQTAISALVASSPAALDTLKELATALGNDPNFATTMTAALGERVKTSDLRDAYGIGNAPVITNLNTAGMGSFIVAGNATGVPPEMSPGDYAIGRTTMGDAVAVRAQTLLVVNTGRTYRRTFGAGAYGAWGGIVDTGYQATESAIGVMRVATEAGVNGGGDDTTAVTPKKLRLGVSLSLGTNGYLVLPTWLGGFVFQWGFVSSASAVSGTVNYPIQFPTACFGGVIQGQYTTNEASSFTVRNSSVGTNGWALARTFFTWDSTQSSRSLSFNWFAWGN